MNKSNIYLDKVISGAIHLPKINGIPLYVRVDDRPDEEIENYVKDNEEWVKAAKKYSGSPDNIRRVFITYNAIYVHLYRPVGSGTSLSREIKHGIPFSDIYEEMCNSMSYGVRPSKEVKGIGLRALYKPWVCSNIEEVYFDDTMFLSETTRQLGFGDLTQYYSNENNKDHLPIKALFEVSCLQNIASLQDRYPRLKVVGYVRELDELYRRSKVSIDKITKRVNTWYSMIKIVETNPCAHALYVISEDNLNTKYSIKEGIYKYDKYVLKPYFEAMKKKINEHKKMEERQKTKDIKDIKVGVSVKKTEKSALEVMLDGIYEREGPEKAELSFRFIVRDFSRDKVLEVLNDMSDEGRERYNII
jgi:hypothetical protein